MRSDEEVMHGDEVMRRVGKIASRGRTTGAGLSGDFAQRALGIEDETHMGVLGKPKFLDLAVPVPDADEEFFDMIAGRIHAEDLVLHVELQESIVHIGPYLLRYVHTAVTGAVFRGHQFAALGRRRACGQKDERQTTDHNRGESLFHKRPFSASLNGEAPSLR